MRCMGTAQFTVHLAPGLNPEETWDLDVLDDDLVTLAETFAAPSASPLAKGAPVLFARDERSLL